MRLTISHWLPLVTRCPVNGLPDLCYIYVTIEGFAELYEARKHLFSGFFMNKLFMEDMLKEVWTRAKQLEVGGKIKVIRCEVVLLGGRHRAVIEG